MVKLPLANKNNNYYNLVNDSQVDYFNSQIMKYATALLVDTNNLEQANVCTKINKYAERLLMQLCV